MSATLAPQGLVPARHPSGTIRVENQVDGILSGYTSNIFTGTPVMRGTDGTLQVTSGAAGACIGVFAGCEFTAATKRFVLPYFPAGQTYDAGSMIAKYTADYDIIFEGQSLGPVPMTAMGEACNIGAVTGSTFTGFSTQALSAPTGATAGTFTIVGLSAYDDNRWGDLFTRILVQINAKQAQIA